MFFKYTPTRLTAQNNDLKRCIKDNEYGFELNEIINHSTLSRFVRIKQYLVPEAISRSSQCSTTGVTKAVVCAILSMGGERNVLFNDALNKFYLRLYGVRHMVKDNSDSEKGNPLPPHRLLFPISSKGSFICTIPQTG